MTTGSTRQLLISVMIDMIADQGFEGLSVRAVAAQAGVSTGSVQHHFPTKNEMLEAAMTSIAKHAAARGGELEEINDPEARLHALVDLLIPSNASDRVARVWIAFTARAAIDAKTRDTYQRLWARLKSELRLLIAGATGKPDTAADASYELLALCDGLALSIVAEHQDPEKARRLAHRRVDVLLGHEAS